MKTKLSLLVLALVFASHGWAQKKTDAASEEKTIQDAVKKSDGTSHAAETRIGTTFMPPVKPMDDGASSTLKKQDVSLPPITSPVAKPPVPGK